MRRRSNRAEGYVMDRGRLSPFLASFSVGLQATPLLPDNLLIGCNVPRFAVGACAYVPTLLLHATGSPFKEEFNRSIMRHQVAVSDHFPILFKIEAAFRACNNPTALRNRRHNRFLLLWWF